MFFSSFFCFAILFTIKICKISQRFRALKMAETQCHKRERTKRLLSNSKLGPCLGRKPSISIAVYFENVLLTELGHFSSTTQKKQTNSNGKGPCSEYLTSRNKSFKLVSFSTKSKRKDSFSRSLQQFDEKRGMPKKAVCFLTEKVDAHPSGSFHWVERSRVHYRKRQHQQ